MGVRISFAAHLKPVPVAGFIIDYKNSVKTLSKVFHYRKPRIVKAKQGWYIEYYYRIPVDVRYLYNDKEWFRFRITEDMNRRSGSDKEEYASWLLQQISFSLQNGYNPFQPELEYNEKEMAGLIIPEQMSAKEALLLFLEKWKNRNIEKQSLAKYERYINRLTEWLSKKNMLHQDVQLITQDHIETFLSAAQKQYNYSNREYNNSLDFIRTAFNFLLKKEIIDKNPCIGIDKQKAKTNKHRFYDAESLNTITKALTVKDPYTYLACQVVYYLCVRSDKELMNLKVGNISWEQNTILAEAEGTKTKSARYIPLDDNIKQLLLQHNVKDYPAHYYIFGINGTPSEKSFGTGFFAKRFRKVREAAGLPEHFSIYGFKHTRVIHLKQDGATDADIMSLTGHKDFQSYAKYLRDLGLAADAAKISKLSRKL